TSSRPLLSGTPWWTWWPDNVWANALIEEARIDTICLERPPIMKTFFGLDQFNDQLGWIYVGSDSLAIPGSPEDALIQLGNDVMMLQGSTSTDRRYIGRR